MYVYSMNYELWLPFIQLQDINKKLENIMLKYTYKKKLVDYNRILHKRIFLCWHLIYIYRIFKNAI